MPASKTTRALTFAGLAALAGAAAWGLLVYSAHVESGWLAWGIGALIGFVAVKAGGHGTPVALGAAVLTVLSIVSGKQFAFHMFVDRAADEYVAEIDADTYAERTKDASDWVALGAQPTPEQIRVFADEHGFEPTTPQAFAADMGPRLTHFAETKPTIEQWRDEEHAGFVASASFLGYLQADFHPADILFVLLGIASAFGLVSNHTTRLHVEVRAAERRRRDTEVALAAEAERKAGAAVADSTAE